MVLTFEERNRVATFAALLMTVDRRMKADKKKPRKVKSKLPDYYIQASSRRSKSYGGHGAQGLFLFTRICL